MKKNYLSILFLFITSLAIGQTPNFYINKANISQEDYELDVAESIAYNISYGAGVDMRNPSSPKGSTGGIAFDKTKLPDSPKEIANTPIQTNNSFVYDFKVIENTNTSRYSKSLYANFKASYGLNSLSASYSRSISEKKSSHSVIIYIESIFSPDLSNSQFDFIAKPESETIADEEIALDNFLNKHGSHYITKIDYGYRIVLKATTNKRNYSDVKSFTADLKLAIDSFEGSGEIKSKEEIRLSQNGTIVEGKIIAGQLSPDRPYTLNSINQVKKFLNELNEGNITVYRKPLKIYLKSYFQELSDFPRTQKMLAYNQSFDAQSKFGVPKGTIIAWNPPSDLNLKKDKNTWIPEGWVICDGTLGSPDLTDRFIMGSTIEQITETGGTTEHSHKAHGVNYDLAPDASHDKTGALIEKTNHLPPYYKLMFIMKL